VVLAAAAEYDDVAAGHEVVADVDPSEPVEGLEVAVVGTRDLRFE
jgi:hypothetical protein